MTFLSSLPSSPLTLLFLVVVHILVVLLLSFYHLMPLPPLHRHVPPYPGASNSPRHLLSPVPIWTAGARNVSCQAFPPLRWHCSSWLLFIFLLFFSSHTTHIFEVRWSFHLHIKPFNPPNINNLVQQSLVSVERLSSFPGLCHSFHHNQLRIINLAQQLQPMQSHVLEVAVFSTGRVTVLKWWDLGWWLNIVNELQIAENEGRTVIETGFG